MSTTTVLLDNHLSTSHCRVFNSDCRVNLLGSQDYTYPDGSVSVELQSIDLRFPIEQIYRGIDFSETTVEPIPSEPSWGLT